MSKLMLLAALGAFSCAGEQLAVVDTEIGPAVEVPDEFVDVALAHGLLDLEAESDRLIAEAEAKALEAADATTKSKAAKSARAVKPEPVAKDEGALTPAPDAIKAPAADEVPA